MKPKSTLFDLVKSLSTSEKRYFKQHAPKGKSSIEYIALFDAINKQKAYDETSLKQKFNKKSLSNQFSVSKNYLTQLVVESLVSYHKNATIGSRLLSGIARIKVLFTKAQFEAAEREIGKLKKLAGEYQYHHVIPEIIRWEKKICSALITYGTRSSKLPQIFEEERRILRLLLKISKLEEIQQSLLRLYLNAGVATSPCDLERYEALVQNPVLRDKEFSNEFIWQDFQLNIWYIHARCTLHGDKAFKHARSRVELYERHPQILKERLYQYLGTLSNLLSCQYQHVDSEIFKGSVEKMNNVIHSQSPKLCETDKIKYNTVSSLAMIGILRWHGQFENASLEIISGLTSFLSKYHNQLSEIHRIAFYLNFAFVFFGAGKIDKSMNWLNNLLNKKYAKDCFEDFMKARLLYIICQIELNNTEQAMNESNNLFRQMNRHKVANSFVKKLLHELGMVYSNLSKDSATIKTQFGELARTLRSERDKSLDPNDMEYRDFYYWVVSKAEGTSFKQAIDQMQE